MTDYIYCGTYRYVDDINTQASLLGQFHAIWYPPMARIIPPPFAEDRVWLVHRTDGAVPVMLGGGCIIATDAGNVLWSNATLPGAREEAIAIGYPWRPDMDFLKLNNVVPGNLQPVANLGEINTGLKVATALQVAVLTQLLPIP